MENNKEDRNTQGLESAVSLAIEDLAAEGFTEEQIRARLESILDARLGNTARTDALARLRAAVEVARTLGLMEHRLALAAKAGGASWGVIGAVAGITAQSAWKRWKDRPEDGPELQDIPDQAAAALDGWANATTMARRLGVDPRTVRAMAERGELDVIERRSEAGRNQDLYRAKP